MKILCLHRDSGPSYVARGWQQVLEYCGHSFDYWHKGEATFDAFGRVKPDLFIGTTWDADEAFLKVCQRRPEMRVALYAGTWGDLADTLDPAEYPIVRCDNKAFLERLKRLTGKPDLVWLHVTPTYLEPVLGGYRSIGIEPVGITNGADLFTYMGGEAKPEYSCDCVFIGGRWGYKARAIDRFIGPLLHPDSGLSCRVFGSMTWPHGNYLGLLDEGEARHAFRSAKVCPSIGEPHSFIFSDVVERYYKCGAAGGFVVGGPEVGLEEEFGPGLIPQGKTPAMYAELVRHYVHSPAERCALADRQREAVVARHSYFERVASLFRGLNLPLEAEKVSRAKADFLRERYHA